MRSFFNGFGIIKVFYSRGFQYAIYKRIFLSVHVEVFIFDGKAEQSFPK